MKLKKIGAFHFNNYDNRITFLLCILNLDELLLSDVYWTQWENTLPRKFYNNLLHCQTFTRHSVGSKNSNINCDMIGYNKYDVGDKYVKYLSRFDRIKPLKLTHTKYNQVLDDNTTGKNRTKYMDFNPIGMVKKQLPHIFYHTDGNIKIIYHNRYTPTDYGMAYLNCMYMALTYMRNEKLIN